MQIHKRVPVLIFVAYPLLGCVDRDKGPTANVSLDNKDKNSVQALFGGTSARNMANVTDKNLPEKWSAADGKHENIKWFAELGNKAYGGPVIADGKVYVGTNNFRVRDPKIKGQRAVLMCFQESDGKFLWQIAHDFPSDELFNEAQSSGLCSTPCVEKGRLYYVTPGCEVICADAAEGKILWRYDMMKELKVVPFHCGNCSPLIVGDLVMIVTSNGVNNDGKVVSPKAPSFIALKKDKGELAWQSSLPGENIIEGQWSNPAFAVVNGRAQVIFPGGDAILYSLDPKTGAVLWKCDCLPDRKAAAEKRAVVYFIGTPVIYDNKAYVTMGLYPDHPYGTPPSYVLCIDMSKSGDVSPKSLDSKAPANKESALVWAFGGSVQPRPAKGRREYFASTMSTCAIHDGLLYVSEIRGYLHCLDAKTGQRYWEHDLKTGIWGSPYYADGKVYLGTDDAEVVVLQHGKEKKVLAANELDDGIQSTPVVANGVLYVMTNSKLYAIAQKK